MQACRLLLQVVAAVLGAGLAMCLSRLLLLKVLHSG